MTAPLHEEPLLEVERDGVHYTLLGTAHVSRASAEAATRLVESGAFDGVAVELCPSRYQAVTDPESIARMDLLRVIREGKVPMVTANLALGAFQQRIAEQLGVEPGAEMRAAIDAAARSALPVVLIDREVGVTLRRIYRSVPWWRRLYLFSGLVAGLISREQVQVDEVERLKGGDILEATFAEFADTARDLYRPLIEERDRYMAARLRTEYGDGPRRRVLAVIGAGHLAGVARHLREEPAPPAGIIATLDEVPPAGRWGRRLAWLLVAVIVTGFVVGFMRSPALGVQLLADWVLINGGLAALGAAVAAGHPLTVAAAFLAAPLTSLNPTVGVGMVSAATEVYVRRPTVGDFGRLRRDTLELRGWRRNRVARTLAVFVLSTVGSAIGTYAAGFRILERLAG